ncbi:hypothetical protein RAS2_21390 [Phycisphaerae bacterium RAS2]|nr:hypothetical protein RAS2_21390 [Phycisphaerae bacterium RAS2]
MKPMTTMILSSRKMYRRRDGTAPGWPANLKLNHLWILASAGSTTDGQHGLSKRNDSTLGPDVCKYPCIDDPSPAGAGCNGMDRAD